MPAASDLLRRLADAAERASRSLPRRLAGFSALALSATWMSLRRAAEMNTFRDAQVLLQYEDVARRTVLHYGQVPLWDPYYCGGMDLLGTPQSHFASPTFLLTLLFGTLRAEPLIAFAMIVLGLEGAYRYARSHGAPSLGAAVAAPIFAMSGGFAFAGALSWTNFYGFELLPWVALGVRGALGGARSGVVLAACSMAFIVGFGGTYAAPMAALLAAFEVALFLLRERRRRRALATGAAMATACALLGLAMSAFRLLPIAHALAMAPRVIGGAPGNRWLSMLHTTMLPINGGAGGDFNDHGTYYIGAAALFAAGVGLTVRRARPMLVGGVLATWLAAGYAVRPSLFAMLKALPVYEALRYPERFLYVLALFVAVAAAFGVGLLHVRARRERAGGPVLFVMILLLAANAGVMAYGFEHVAIVRSADPRPAEAPPRPFHQARGNRWVLMQYPAQNRGSLACWEAYPVPESALLRADLPDEAYLAEGARGSVRTAAWSPDRMALDVTLDAPGRVRVNQNWHPGWKTSEGAIADDHGLLAVDLPAGHHQVVLRFLPRAALAGGAASLAALLLAAWLVRRDRTRGRLRRVAGDPATFAALLLPFVPAALVFAVMHEPPLPSIVAKTSSGDDVIADAPPPGAKPAGVKFEGGLELVAIRLDPPQPVADQTAHLELDWRVQKDVRRGVGVFMHIQPNGTDSVNGDHAQVSRTLLFDDAPPGKILRDEIPLSIPPDWRGKQVEIYAGLWMMRGNGTRLRVTDHGAVQVQENRLLVSSFEVR